MVRASLGQLLRSAIAAADAKRLHGEFDCQSSAIVWLEQHGVEVDTALASDLLFGGYAVGVGKWGETYTAEIKGRIQIEWTAENMRRLYGDAAPSHCVYNLMLHDRGAVGWDYWLAVGKLL